MIASTVAGALLAASPAVADPTTAGLKAAGALPKDSQIDEAKAKAKRTGERVKIASMLTESSTTWANPDGRSLRTEYTAGPTRVKNGNEWEDIDTTLTVQGGKIAPKVTKTPIELSAGGSGPLLMAGGVKLGWDGTLPKPTIDGNRATYHDAAGKGADVVVTATATGYRTEIVLRERPADQVEYSLPMALPKGRRFGTDKAGNPQLQNAKGKPVGTPIAAEAVDAKAVGSLSKGKRSDVDAKVSNETLVLSPDKKFLDSSDVAYPVTLAVPGEWTGVGLRWDTFISTDYTEGNQSATWMHAGKYGNGTGTSRAFLRFDIEDRPLSGAKILDSNLTLQNYKSHIADSQCVEVPGSGIDARRITGSWEPSTLKWSAQPATTTTGAYNNAKAYGAPACPEGQLLWSVETITQAWADGTPNYGFQLRARSEADTTNWRMFRSAEYDSGSQKPKLTVNYEPAAIEPVFWTTTPDKAADMTDYDKAKAAETETFDTEPTVQGISPEEAAQISEQSTNTSKVLHTDLEDPVTLTRNNFYKRLTPEECEQNKTEAVKRSGWTKNSYNWCYIYALGATFFTIKDGAPVPVARVEITIMQTIHTWAGGLKGTEWAEREDAFGGIDSRETTSWAIVLDSSVTGDPRVTKDNVRLRLRAISGESGCTAANDLAETGREDTLAGWAIEPNARFQLLSEKEGSTGPHKVGQCTISQTFALSVPTPFLPKTAFGRSRQDTTPVRCDTSEEVLAYYGGCVMSNHSPTFVANMIRGGSGGEPIQNESSALIDRALDTPNDTYPPGDGNKKIPGAFGVSKLHRTSDDGIATANRTKSQNTCKAMLGDEPPPQGKDCDEYPFARTAEGSAQPADNQNFAVDFVDSSDNRSVGSTLGRFFLQQRLLGTDILGTQRISGIRAFWVGTAN